MQHLLFTLRLNFRSPMPVIYGYLVPIFFLIGFAAVFHGQPPVTHELGQLLTITTLGGACFGMPTALVAERSRGIWRRYRLLPMATGALILSTMVARLALVASAALLQIVLAMLIYHMPPPARPGELAIAFLLVAAAFLGMGLIIAMLAENVPAVQALGQAIFLPMILIGGVGVPLRVLPQWAQVVAAFMPGRYAVEALNAPILGNDMANFALLALAVIAIAALVAGAKMFRWDAQEKLPRHAKFWIAAALAAWAGVGVAALSIAKSDVAAQSPSQAYEAITDAQIAAITYDDLQDDSSMVTPVVNDVDDLPAATKTWMEDFRQRLFAWPPGQEADLVQRTRNLLAIAAIADLDEYQHEGEIPVVVFQTLKEQIPKGDLEKILAQIILRPADGAVPTNEATLGIPGDQKESDVRDRTAQYAKKLLGRLVGKLG